MIKKKDSNSLEKVRHSLSHLMSMAIMEKYPDAGLGVGPSIENGFYQDYDLPEQLSEKDFAWIEKRIRELIAQKIKFVHAKSDFAAALKFYKKDPYKKELIKELKAAGEKKVSFYDSDWFHNLCAGPHVRDTSEINPEAFKLDKVAGAYWRGSEKNPMLQRVYGLAFTSKDELDAYIKMQEEADRRDHRKLGEDLDLFVFSDTVGKGLPLWTPRGSIIRRELERFITDEELKRGYLHVYTPDIAKLDLYRKSGHYPYYRDSMYSPIVIDDEEFMLRPMTCPHHFELYLSRKRSYRELPMRIAELAKLYRYEQSGELSGLMRVRGFCLADAHIICADASQAKEEIGRALDLIEYIAGVFGLKLGADYWYRLSLGDRKNKEKFFKNDRAWSEGETMLRSLLASRHCTFVEAKGEAAFYGPKVDIQMKNVRGREDTAFTVQYDFCMPGRFNLVYIGEDGKEHETVVVHRSSVGAIERTIAFLIEHYAGAFPVWLSPVQVEVIPVADRHLAACRTMAGTLTDAGIRVHVAESNETVGHKIRRAEKEKVPYMIVLGDKEAAAKEIPVRVRGSAELKAMTLETLRVQIVAEITQRK